MVIILKMSVPVTRSGMIKCNIAYPPINKAQYIKNLITRLKPLRVKLQFIPDKNDKKNKPNG